MDFESTQFSFRHSFFKLLETFEMLTGPQIIMNNTQLRRCGPKGLRLALYSEPSISPEADQ